MPGVSGRLGTRRQSHWLPRNVVFFVLWIGPARHVHLIEGVAAYTQPALGTAQLDKNAVASLSPLALATLAGYLDARPTVGVGIRDVALSQHDRS